jgi:hypothetical protein
LKVGYGNQSAAALDLVLGGPLEAALNPTCTLGVSPLLPMPWTAKTNRNSSPR